MKSVKICYYGELVKSVFNTSLDTELDFMGSIFRSFHKSTFWSFNFLGDKKYSIF